MPRRPILKLSPDFADALAFAAYLHVDQMRKLPEDDASSRPVPYIAHLLAVASLVLEHGGTEDQAIGALLHDALEDQAGPHGADADGLRDRILRRYGPAVLEIVEGCSDSYGGSPRAPWKERKEAYLKHLAEAPPAVLLVSAADKLHNARSVLEDHRETGDEVWRRFTASKEGQLWYFRSLADTFRAAFQRHGMDGRIVGQLERVVVELEQRAGA